ncbi:MAG: SAM-dependent methyltransferase [Burkholderiales bacterium RIFCSPLOWO2_02_FULL_57_36]|nr:MAG: SAM-dependent methyltransferase [Burkholderiales bacterium RIFCSPLOWO2_02_FULL_57_36]
MKTATFNQPPQTSFKTRRSVLNLCLAGIASGLTGFRAEAQQVLARPLDVPYEPSPLPVVDRMLEMAKVGKDDLLYDLGSGDGRIVIAAAKKYGARGIGIDLDPKRVDEATVNAKNAGVEDRVQFMVGDLFKSDFSDASVVTLYLFPTVNLQLRPELWRQLKVGTRVVSHTWDMGPEWPPEKTEKIQGRTIHYWTITEAQKRAIGK